MKFPKLKGKDWVMVAIIVAALALGWYAYSRSREGFTDGGWKKDDGTLESVAITEDGTLWGTAPGNRGYTIWRKPAGGSWSGVTGTAKKIDAKDANTAVIVGTDDSFYQTSDGGKTWAAMGGNGKWITIGDDGGIKAIDKDGKVIDWAGNRWVFSSWGGEGSLVTLGGAGMMQIIGTDGNIYDLTADRRYQNTGAASRNVALAKDGLSVEVNNPSGDLYYRVPGKPYEKFSSPPGGVRYISASTTKLAAVTNDNAVWTMDITGAPAAPAPAAPAPAPAPVPEPTSGIYSANCARCQVINNQISCSCEVAPK